MDTATYWKKLYFILLDRSNFYRIDNLWIAFHAFARCMLTSFSVDEMLLPRYVNWSTNFRGLLHRVEMASSCLKHMNSVLFTFMLHLMPLTAFSRLCSGDSVWVGVFARSARSSVLSTSVIVSLGYHLLLGFFYVKLFFFVKAIDIQST